LKISYYKGRILNVKELQRTKRETNAFLQNYYKTKQKNAFVCYLIRRSGDDSAMTLLEGKIDGKEA